VAIINQGRVLRTLPALAFGLAFLAGGCNGPPQAKVHGTVNLDGKPIKDGSIEFFPIDGKGQTAGAAIRDGTYSVDASVGEMTVRINAIEVIGKRKAYDTPDSPMVENVRNPIPARYNTQSELKRTLVAGDNEVNFELTTKKKTNSDGS
jgi:hypothetical protein